jgi:hypothetical protein
MKKILTLLFCAVFCCSLHDSAHAAAPAGSAMGSAGLMFLAAMPFDKVVGDTNDGCDKNNPVKIQARDGQKSIPHSTKNFPVDLPGMVTEIHFYCGGTRERAANDTPFDKLLMTRAANGAIHIVFLVASAPPPNNGSGGGANTDSSWIHVGDSKDPCDAKHDVKLQGTVHPVMIPAGQSAIAEIPQLTRELYYTCGSDNARVANDKEFNRVQVERAGNGAIQWVFFRTPSLGGTSPTMPHTGAPATATLSASDDLGDFLHNARGTMVIQAPQAPQPIPSVPLKQKLDKSWDDNRATATAKLKATIAAAGYGQAQVNLSTSSQSELRLAQSPEILKFKYVVHGNHGKATIDGASAEITFDAEVVLALPRAQKLDKLQSGSVMAFVRHVEIEGGDALGTIAVGLLKSRARALETKIGNFSQDAPELAKNVNDLIDQLRSSIPVSPSLVTVDLGQTRLGNIAVCAFVGSAVCRPAPDIGSLPVPQNLGHSDDQCGEGKVWLWDYELGRYTSIAKGQNNFVVQVDNKRFEWYCGDDNAPDPRESNQGSASGPAGTFAVRVARDPDGRAIHWQFLSWR